jgi:hypothetical protein
MRSTAARTGITGPSVGRASRPPAAVAAEVVDRGEVRPGAGVLRVELGHALEAEGGLLGVDLVEAVRRAVEAALRAAEARVEEAEVHEPDGLVRVEAGGSLEGGARLVEVALLRGGDAVGDELLVARLVLGGERALLGAAADALLDLVDQVGEPRRERAEALEAGGRRVARREVDLVDRRLEVREVVLVHVAAGEVERLELLRLLVVARFVHGVLLFSTGGPASSARLVRRRFLILSRRLSTRAMLRTTPIWRSMSFEKSS